MDLLETQSQSGLPHIFVKKMDARGGIEPPIRDLQSPAVPLGYPATKKPPLPRRAGASRILVLRRFVIQKSLASL